MWAKYIFRIDDVVPWMNWDNFEKIEKIFDKYWVKPIIWVVPNNQDLKIWNNEYNHEFWDKIKSLHGKWWTIAQHWYHHKYLNKNWGILKINKKWEFAWLPYKEQFEMIKNGKDILEKNLWFEVKRRMAPAHSFDETTCKVLKDLGFEYVTDWIALYPFTKYWLKWLPQQIREPIEKKYWIWTICLHINWYTDCFINNLKNFLDKSYWSIITINDFDYKQNFLKNFFSFIYKIKFYAQQFLYKIYIYLFKKGVKC